MNDHSTQEKIMLIDGHSILHRAFYGVPLLTNSKGLYTNAIYGFLNIFYKLIEEEQPKYIGVAFDLKQPTFRHEEFEDYKGHRKQMPNELKMQIPIVKDILDAMGVMRFEMSGYEADDILGTLAKKSEDIGFLPVIVSGDRDLLQLATDKIKIRIPKTVRGQTEVENYYAKDVINKYGVTPKEFIEVKGLMGDPSDNIPGVPGIGEKTATKIIQKYQTIEEAILHAKEIKPKRASENLEIYKEQARMSKFLATICTDCPISFEPSNMRLQSLMNEKTYEMLKELEFRSILERFSFGDLSSSSFLKSAVLEKGKKINSVELLQKWVNHIGDISILTYLMLIEKEEIKGIGFIGESLAPIWIEISDTLSSEQMFFILKPIFENESIYKITHQAKMSIRFLWKYGVQLKGLAFDTMIGAYLLNPLKEHYGYDDLARDFLNEVCPSEEEILGKGKQQKSLMDLPEEEKMNYIYKQLDIVARSKQVIEKKIKENYQETLYYDIELPLIEVLASMEEYGLQIDTEILKEYAKKLDDQLYNLTQAIYSLAGETFNINSPKQLGSILFEKLQLPPIKKTKTGYSTAADVLEKLVSHHEIVEKILDYRQLMKLKTTYADGLFAVINPQTDKVHSTFHQTITATGRISSSEPNLQNIPIKLALGREIRKAFIPSSEEYVFIDADYSQIELRVLAHISQDKTLIQAFKENQDIHRLTASQVFKIPFEQVTEQQRSNAKAVNFGIVYGISAFSLSQDLKISKKEADQYIQGYFEKYPKVKEYLDRTIVQAKETGYVSTLFERRRPMSELHSSNFVQRSFGERVAMNMPIQGTAADIIKIAMVHVYKEFQKRNLRSRLILQVHDELLIEAHMDEVEEVKQIVKDIMENAVQLDVPLEVDMKEGHSWFHVK
ncbi:MAG: DNA polymerase I [Epulopiscium sp.]|nr:DNA polymerase I [Candidatus Epulonipiscium sp.]